MKKRQITDEDVARRIEHMREKAGSDDLHAMVKAWMQDTVDWYYWREKTFELIQRNSFVWLFLFCLISFAFLFSFWVASTFDPVVVGAVSGALAVFAAALLLGLAKW